MELSTTWTVFINRLIYGVQYSSDPLTDVERIKQLLLKQSDITIEEYVSAIRMALNSEMQIVSFIIPQPHTEEVIRSFLTKMLEGLTDEIKNSKHDPCQR